MGWSIKKPLGGKSGIVRQVISKPLATGAFGALGAAYTGMKANEANKMAEMERQNAANQGMAQNEFERRAAEEEARRTALGQRQQGQILQFAGEFEKSAAERRRALAESLNTQGNELFQRANPFILEDLQSRGLASSESTVANEQAQALKDIALENQGRLNTFDNDIFNQITDLKSGGLSALMGGEQSALDSALELRRSQLNRTLDVQDQDREERLANFLARRQSRDQLIASIMGGASRLGAAHMRAG